MANFNLSLSMRSMLVYVLFGCCHLATSQRPGPTAAPGAGGYLDIRRDGSYRYAYATGDRGRHYHTAVASPDNTVTGRYGQRDPKTGNNQETSYTAGRNGFRARGPHIARKMSLSQNKIPYNPPVNPNSPNYKPSYSGYNDPNNDPTYEFGFRTPTHSRQESSNSRGNVEGSYTYVDDVGVRHNVAYEAGSKTGFHVKTPFPDSDSIGGALFYRKPNKGGKGFRGHSAIQQNTDGSFRFTATGPDQKHTEVSDKNGNRRGTYTYLDDKGVQRTTEYIAGPGIGYKVINTKLSNQFSQTYPFLPPSFLIPPTSGENVKDEDIFGQGENLNTAATSAGLKPSRPTSTSGEDDSGDYDDKLGGGSTDEEGNSGYPSSPPDSGDDGNDYDGGGKPKPSRPKPTKPFLGFKPKPQENEGSGDGEDDSSEDLGGQYEKPEIGNFGESGSNSGDDDDVFGSNDKRPSGGQGGNKRPTAATFPSSRPTKRPNKRPTFGQGGNRPTDSGYKPSSDDDDDDIFGPDTHEDAPHYGSSLGNDDDNRPSKFDGNDDVFGPPNKRPSSFGSGGPDFSKPVTGDPPGFNKPNRPGRPGRPTRPRPSGFGPDSHQQGSDANNCCNNRGNTKYDNRYPNRNPHNNPSYGHVSDFSYDQQSAHNSIRERFFTFPPGVAVRAHVQSLDIVPYGSRMPSPGVALDQIPRNKYRRQSEHSDKTT